MGVSKKSQRSEYSASTVDTIWQFHRFGVSGAEIGTHLGIPKSSVNTIIRRLQNQTQPTYQKPRRTGRPPKLDERAERHFIRRATSDPFAALKVLATPSKTGGLPIHINTARKYLAKHEYYAFKPRRKPWLSPQHKKTRLRFAKLHQYDSLEDVACMAFCDESTFEVGIDTRPPYVRRKAGNGFESRYLRPTFRSGRSTISVFGVISLDFKSELFVNIKGERNNAKRYCRILHNVGMPFYQRLIEERGEAVWVQDGARIHTAKLTQKYLDDHFVTRLDWPPQSPDLNPIENLWRLMKLRISKRRGYIHTQKQMARILREEWDRITPEDYRKCISSWSKRMKEVIKNKGGSTHY